MLLVIKIKAIIVICYVSVSLCICFSPKLNKIPKNFTNQIVWNLKCIYKPCNPNCDINYVSVTKVNYYKYTEIILSYNYAQACEIVVVIHHKISTKTRFIAKSITLVHFQIKKNVMLPPVILIRILLCSVQWCTVVYNGLFIKDADRILFLNNAFT